MNYRLSECQLLPSFGSRPAIVSVFFQLREVETRLVHLVASIEEGRTGAFPFAGLFRRAALNGSPARLEPFPTRGGPLRSARPRQP